MKNILGVLTIAAISVLATGCANADVGLAIEPPTDITCQYVWYPASQSYVWVCPEWSGLGVPPVFAYDRRVPREYGFRFRYDVPRREVPRGRVIENHRREGRR